ncbi:MAG: hydroxyacid dehydrogenase, partial [Phycisphaerae bacterium]|nr:hydroxyacid dehydrogenase [Phycisphaerae bacterium]
MTTTRSSTSAASPASASAPGPTATILIADKFEPSGIAAARALGCQVESQPDLNTADLAAAIAETNPHILIVRSTKVPAAAFDAGEQLSLVIRAGAGYDNIDVAAASDHGVFVANCPGKNACAVAEMTWGLILACDRRIPDQTADLRRGVWDKKGYGKSRGLFGRTLGIVGLGRIGREVARRGRAFGMNVVAYSRSLTPEQAEELDLVYCASPLDVAKAADVVSIHVASTPDTAKLVDDRFCEALQPNAILINTSRGAVVDEAALTRAIRKKGLRVGLDVYGQQPAPTEKAFEDPIVQESGVYGTHHAGASTDQAQEAIAAETVRIIATYLARGEVPNCVNRADASPATCLLTVRHLNRTGVLAHVFHVLSDAGINVEEM